jgi:hypothetical protein
MVPNVPETSTDSKSKRRYPLLAVSSELPNDHCEIVERVSYALPNGKAPRDEDITTLAPIAKGLLERRLKAQIANLLTAPAALSGEEPQPNAVRLRPKAGTQQRSTDVRIGPGYAKLEKALTA